MHNFRVIKGKESVNYKPDKKHYAVAVMRNVERLGENANLPAIIMAEKYPDELKRLLYLSIRFVAEIFDFSRKYSEEELKEYIALVSNIEDMLGYLTPRGFMMMFPVKKEYDGKKYQCKDYYTTMEAVGKIGMDRKIGAQVNEFLFDYCNPDIDNYMVVWMGIINRMYQINGGKDITLDFFKSHGTPLHTYHQQDDYMIDDETGERFKVQKPKNPMRKFFSIVESE